jgi:ferredoxin
MLLTLGVKNLFGCVVGMRKPEWHLRAGVDREMFARLLVRVYQTVQPAVTVIDGRVAMHGQGPGRGGTPIALNVLLGSRDTVALDMVVCKLLGVEPETLLTNKIALEEGMVNEQITMNGTLPEVRDFRMPEIAPLIFGPAMLHGFMRRHLVQRPECNEDLCKMCGECWKYCPAEAITPSQNNIHFNYDQCIRCYCCVEICPHGALFAHETVTGKVARKILRISD